MDLRDEYYLYECLNYDRTKTFYIFFAFAETTNPVFFELNGNIESLTRRNSYCQAVEHDDLIKGSIDENVDVVGHTDASEQGKKKAINFFRAILIPGVIVVCIYFYLQSYHVYYVYTKYTTALGGGGHDVISFDHISMYTLDSILFLMRV